jgi:hypothetical protein
MEWSIENVAVSVPQLLVLTLTLWFAQTDVLDAFVKMGFYSMRITDVWQKNSAAVLSWWIVLYLCLMVIVLLLRFLSWMDR